MKLRILSLLSLLALASCNFGGVCLEGKCDQTINPDDVTNNTSCENSSLLGLWESDSGNANVEFTNECKFFSTYNKGDCKVTGVYGATAAAKGNALVDVQSLSDATKCGNLKETGEMACAFEIDGKTFKNFKCNFPGNTKSALDATGFQREI